METYLPCGSVWYDWYSGERIDDKNVHQSEPIQPSSASPEIEINNANVSDITNDEAQNVSSRRSVLITKDEPPINSDSKKKQLEILEITSQSESKGKYNRSTVSYSETFVSDEQTGKNVKLS